MILREFGNTNKYIINEMTGTFPPVLYFHETDVVYYVYKAGGNLLLPLYRTRTADWLNENP